MRNFIYNPPDSNHLDIIYKDEDIIVINKPAGLLTVAGKGAELADCLEARVKKEYRKASIVHRLDCDTSGLLIMALHIDSHRNLSQDFAERKIKKTYVAEVLGHVKEAKGVIDLPIRCDIKNRPKQIVDFINGKEAITNFRILKLKQKTTILELKPITGRTHQLRLHLKELGHAIIGDRIYADDTAFNMAERLHLHAAKLEFRHPITKEYLSFNALVPFFYS